MIHGYISYGTRDNLYVRGRVLENEGITLANPHDSLFTNMKNMAKRLESDEIPGVKLRLKYGTVEVETVSDEEGYFNAELRVQGLPENKLWHEVEITAIVAPEPYLAGTKTRAEILVPPVDARFGVISDVDDTILETGATSLFKMARNTFFLNEKTRAPLEGAADFYKLLANNAPGETRNPFFYVSSSPWNIYDFLFQFLALNLFPIGPILLKDYGISKGTLFSSGHLDHKYSNIKNLLEAYPQLPFILIGDSGQKDPGIYQKVVQDFPDRISAIYIRDVKVKRRSKIILPILEEMNRGKVPMILVENSDVATKDARQRGFI